MHTSYNQLSKQDSLFSRRILSHLAGWPQTNAVLLIPALVFLVCVVAMNWELFVTPLNEHGDLAANSIQVQNAKHLHELLGNYSRWHFHHPGPFFFYLFGAGEAILFDSLHLVPAPLNAQILAEIGFSSLCLFLALYVFHSHVREPLFPPLAIAVSILFLYGVDTALPSSAMTSVWLPFAPLFSFLLFSVSCASIAAGKWKHLPLLAFSGMTMLHAHVAQSFFVTVLTAAALSCGAYREFTWGNPRKTLEAHRYHLGAALGICAVFIMPIAVDWIVHHPNNIDQIRRYLHQHHGERNSPSVTLLYVASFFTFYVTPEIALSKPTPTLRDVLNPAEFVKTYWCAFISLAVFGLVAYFRSNCKIKPFVKILFVEIGLIIALFLYWSWRITGGMYTFNGYFFFSVHLIALLAFSALASTTVGQSLKQRHQIALSCAFVIPVIVIAGVKNSYAGDPDVAPIVSSLRQRGINNAMLITPMRQEIWPLAAGVARYMQRFNMGFCFGPEWEFMYGARHICKGNYVGYRVSFSETSPPCSNPCDEIYSHPNLYVTGAPYGSQLSIPLLVQANDSTHVAYGFDGIEGKGSWSQKEGFLRFYLGPDQRAGAYVLDVTGTMIAGRPVEIKFNGSVVGTINVAGRGTQTFKIDPRSIAWNAANTVTLFTANAGPVGPDDRVLGYYFEQFFLRVDNQGTTSSKRHFARLPETGS